MSWIYSAYRNCKICYVNCNNELILSHLNGSDYTIINGDINFVDSIIDVILVRDYIIIGTKTNDIYYYSITHNKLNFLGNYFVTGMIFHAEYPENYWGMDDIVFEYNLLVASDTKIMLYVNFILSKEFIVSHVIENLFEIRFSNKSNKYYVCVSSEKTYILDCALEIVVVLDDPHKSVVKFAANYYCLLHDGSINVYCLNWLFLQTIKFKKIVSICDHDILALVDSDNNYYHVFFGDTTNNRYSYEHLVYHDDNFHIFILSGKKYLAELNEIYLINTYIIFDSEMITVDKYRNTITCCYYCTDNITRFDAVALGVFITIDSEGIVRTNCVNTKPDAKVTSNIREYKIKLRRITDTKNARLLY